MTLGGVLRCRRDGMIEEFSVKVKKNEVSFSLD